MRIDLVTAITTYHIAGQSGVDERVHSSAGDFQITAQSQTQLLARLRAATAPTADRGNLSTTVTFTTTKKFATPSDAFIAALDYDAPGDREGYLVFKTDGDDRKLLGAVVSPPARRVIGCTLLFDYTATGAGIVTIYSI